MRPAVFVTALVLLQALPAGAQPQPAESASGSITIDKVEIADVGMERMRLSVYPAVIPFMDVRLSGITFYGMRLNEIPIFIPPISERILLQAGHRFPLRQPLQVSVYYRDLGSLQPLIDLVQSGKLTLEGNAVFETRLALLPTLLLRSRTARAPMRFQVEIPVTLPGNRLSRAAALKILETVQPGSLAFREKAIALLDSSDSRQRVFQQYGKSVAFALARYQLVDREGGKRTALELTGVALQIDSRRFLVPRELVEPWRFDAALTMQIKSHRLSVLEGSYELLLWPAGATVAGPQGTLSTDQAFSSAKNQFQIVASAGRESERMVATETGRSATLISVLQRGSASNLALAEFPAPLRNQPTYEIDRHPNPNGYPSLIAFRFAAGSSTAKSEPEILNLSAKLVDGRLILDDPIDASAWGSPLISPNGVVGFIQEERSGILFTSAAEALKLGSLDREVAK